MKWTKFKEKYLWTLDKWTWSPGTYSGAPVTCRGQSYWSSVDKSEKEDQWSSFDRRDPASPSHQHQHLHLSMLENHLRIVRKLGEVHPTSSGDGQTLWIRNPPSVTHSDEPVWKAIVTVLLVMVMLVTIRRRSILFWQCNLQTMRCFNS